MSLLAALLPPCLRSIVLRPHVMCMEDASRLYCVSTDYWYRIKLEFNVSIDKDEVEIGV